MLYREKNPAIIEAFKFEGKVTEELSRIGVMSPNSFQLQMQCPTCKGSLVNHALIGVGASFQVICPNTYIIQGKQGIQLMSAQNFESLYRAYSPQPIVDVAIREDTPSNSDREPEQ